MNEGLSEEELLVLEGIGLLGGAAPKYYLDLYTLKKIVYGRKTPADISKEIDENQNSPDIIHFGPIVCDILDKLRKKDYVRSSPDGLYVGLTREGIEVLKKYGKEELYQKLMREGKVMSAQEYDRFISSYSNNSND